MSTKKIEGYAESMAHHPEAYRFSSCVKTPDANRSTIVVFTGEREPVYTQSEVVAMLREIHEKIEGMAEFADEFYTDAAKETTARTVRAARRHLQLVATKHGFTL